MNTQCVFVNTDQKPLKVKRLGCFKYVKADGRSSELTFQELCEFTYPHPEAPENAVVSVYKWAELDITPGTQNLLRQTIDACLEIGKITQLSN